MALLLKADGEVKNVKPRNGKHFTVKELQVYVGGFIEVVPTIDGLRVVINEDGLMLGLPVNYTVTMAAASPGTQIVGDALLCDPTELS